MKRLFNISLLISSVAMLFATSCADNEDTKPQQNPQPEGALELTFSRGEVTSSSITFTITPNTDNATYYANLYLAEELASERDIAVAATLLAMGDAYTGEQTITVENLMAECEYKVLYFGYEPESKRYTTEYLLSDAIVTGDFVMSESLDLSLVAGSTTWRDAMVKVVPSSSDLEYVVGYMTKAQWDEEFASTPDAIVEKCIAGWEYDVECGIDYLPELDTWQKYMQLCQMSGLRSISVSEYYNMRWAKEYVAYAFGMNDDGYLTADVVAVTFATNTPQASDNQFSIAIGELTASSVAFRITTTNNDPYYVSIQDKRYLERFGEGKAESWEDMIFDLTFSKTDLQILPYLFTGTQELTNASIGKNVDTLHEYQIVVWGFDNGPTTAVYVSDVFQPIDTE